MKGKAADYLIPDQESGVYREDPEQAVRDDVEKHYWLNVGRTIVKDWRLYVMLIPMLLVCLVTGVRFTTAAFISPYFFLCLFIIYILL